MTMDKTDVQILERLTTDARTSFRQIAKELKLSPDTIIERYKTLQEKKIIRGSTIVLNPQKIGYPAMAVFMIDISPTRDRENKSQSTDSSLILDTLIKMINIIIAAKTVGDHDLLAIGVIKDLNHLLQVRNEIAAIPGVKDMEVSFWNEKTQLCPKYFVI